MKKFIFLILGLLFATSAFGQNYFGIGGGGLTGLTFDGSGLRAGAPADSFIFEIPVSFEATVTIISTVTSIFVVDGNKQAQDLARFINDNDGAVGDSTIVFTKLGGITATSLTTTGAISDGTFTVDGSGNFSGVGTLAATGTISSTGDLSAGDDVLLADGAVVGITGNEVITFNAAGSINFTGATVDIDGAFTASTVTSDGAIIAETSLTINPTVVDTEDPSFIIKSDADSDGAATTSEALTINLTAAADPTDALWTATTTQSAGFDFDMPLIASTVSSDGVVVATTDVNWGGQYSLSEVSAGTGAIMNTTAGEAANFRIQPTDRDGTDSVVLNYDAIGQPGDGNRESLSFGYFSATTDYQMYTQESGSGVNRIIRIGHNINPTAFVINTDNSIAYGFETIYVPNAASNSGTSVADDAAITVTNTIMRMVGADADALLDTDPAVNDGTADGQIVIIQGTADGNTVTIADNVNTQLAGGISMTLGDGDVICLMWDSNYSMWIEQYRSDN